MTNRDTTSPDMFEHRERHKSTNMSRNVFKVHPCFRHSCTLQQQLHRVCVTPVLILSSSPSLFHSHVLRGSCAPLSSRTPLGRIQNQTTQTVKCIRYQKQFSIHLWCLGNLHTTFSPTPASCMRFHVGNRHVQFDWIFLSVVSDPCGVMAHWL